LALAVHAEEGSDGEIIFGGLRSGLGSAVSSRAERYSRIARVCHRLIGSKVRDKSQIVQ
jgi:hypothetical protein